MRAKFRDILLILIVADNYSNIFELLIGVVSRTDL